MWVTSARPLAPANRKSRRSSPALDAAVLFRRSRTALLGVSPPAGSQGTHSGRCYMSEFWDQCEGQVIDNRFRLRHYLGGTDDSAVFLTQLADPQSKRAAIKFIPAGPNADHQLSLWRRVKQLEHPNLLRVFETGRWRLQNRDRLYVVMEYAEENLSQILPQRPLTESEVREMLGPVLDALVFLHGKGLVHSRIKPSNILATADLLKLSTDALFPIGESRKSSSRFDVYDAPETAASALTPAADVWSLGMTLVETLTQHVPALQPGSPADPIVPDTLHQPLLDIARHALRRDPRRRWTIPEIAARLNPVAVAVAAAGHSISPLAVPLSTVQAVPAAKLQVPAFEPAAPRAPARPPRPQAENAPKQALVLPNYVVPVAAVLLIIVAVIALPKILGHRPDSSSSASTTAATTTAPAKPPEQPTRREVAPAAKPSPASDSRNSLKAPAEKKPVAPPRSSSVAQPNNSPVAAPTPASVRTGSFPPANAPSAPSSSSASSARGEVLDQILPEASPGALATIHG